MSTTLARPRQTALTTLDAAVQEAATLLRDGTRKAGDKFLAARAIAGWTSGSLPLEYKLALKRANVTEQWEKDAVRFARNPAALERKREQDIEAGKKRRSSAQTIEAPNPVKDLPPKALPSSFGEIHEAVQGWKAATARWRKCRRADKPKEALDWLTVALQHFKFIVERSNLPVVTGLSPDEIIEHLKF